MLYESIRSQYRALPLAEPARAAPPVFRGMVHALPLAVLAWAVILVPAFVL